MIIKTTNFSIERIERPLLNDGIESSADYVIYKVDITDSAYVYDLSNRGFRFLDRLLCFEIESSNVESMLSVALFQSERLNSLNS